MARKQLDPVHHTTFRMTRQDQPLLREAVSADGYAWCKKSVWLRATMMAFLDPGNWIPGTRPWLAFIVDASQERGSKYNESVTLTTDLRYRIWQAATDAQVYAAGMGDECDRELRPYIMPADVLRAAIIWRLYYRVTTSRPR